jgi:hypoxanthine phosphoribosyltransferase
VDLAAVGNDVERVVVTEEELQRRIIELAARIDIDYRDRDGRSGSRSATSR